MKNLHSHTNSSGILYIDDELPNTEIFKMNFSEKFPRIFVANSAEEGLEILEKEDIDLVLSDEFMPGGLQGIEFLKVVFRRWPSIYRIIVSAYTDSERILRAIKLGKVHEYISKPYLPDEMEEKLEQFCQNAKKQKQLYRSSAFGEKVLEKERDASENQKEIGVSEVWAGILSFTEQIASSDISVLIRGETGTGKEVIARRIHNLSSRKNKAFISFNCAAVSESLLQSELFGHEKGAFTGAEKSKMGYFEMAEEGTIFLDEIGDISLKMQTALLRVLQEKEVTKLGGFKKTKLNVRVLAATHKNLENMIEQGLFREDLYYRLNVLPVHLPPLRERLDDIPYLVHSLIKKHHRGAFPKFDAGVFKALQCYHYPGNIRELENMVQRALLLGSSRGHLLKEDFFLSIPQLSKLPHKGSKTLEIQRALDAHEGNISKAARFLGLPRTTLRDKAKRLGLISY